MHRVACGWALRRAKSISRPQRSQMPYVLSSISLSVFDAVQYVLLVEAQRDNLLQLPGEVRILGRVVAHTGIGVRHQQVWPQVAEILLQTLLLLQELIAQALQSLR